MKKNYLIVNDEMIGLNALIHKIVFEKKKDQSLETLVGQIKLSINEIGFNNTANIYSTSDSAKLAKKLLLKEYLNQF